MASTVVTRAVRAVITINPGEASAVTYRGLVSNLTLEAGDVIRIDTGSSGGVGDPAARNPARVADDLRNGYVTAEQASHVYGTPHADVERALTLD